MNKLPAEIATSIDVLVRSRFFQPEKIVERVCEDFDGYLPVTAAQVESRIQKTTNALVAEKKQWPKITDFDRLKIAFEKLCDDPHFLICGHMQGYTQTEGYGECRELQEQLINSDHIRGYCFYTEQDMADAVQHNKLHLAFGPADANDEETRGKEIGELICDVLTGEGLPPKWNRNFDQRIAIPNFQWLKRKISGPCLYYSIPDGTDTDD